MSDLDLGAIKIPGWLPGMTDALIDLAEEHLAENDGQTRKQWVLDTLKDAARAHDVKSIPDWIEHPAEDAIISLVIEAIFSLKFKVLTPEERAQRKLERRARRAEKRASRRAKRAAKKAAKAQQDGS